jgi:hypothetical protein
MSHHVTTCDVLVRHGDCTCPHPNTQVETLAEWLAHTGLGTNTASVRLAIAADLYDHIVKPMLARAWDEGRRAAESDEMARRSWYATTRDLTAVPARPTNPYRSEQP